MLHMYNVFVRPSTVGNYNQITQSLLRKIFWASVYACTGDVVLA